MFGLEETWYDRETGQIYSSQDELEVARRKREVGAFPMTCPACYGTGRDKLGYVCARCGGIGEVARTAW